MSGKKFVRLSLIFSTILLVFIAVLNIVIDPLFQYHKPWFGLEPVIENERYQNAGVIKHFDFDNAVLGTSLSENFRISEVNDTFGGNSVKLTMSGSSIYNMTYQMELMKKREVKPKVIMCDMSPVLFEAPYDKMKNPLPTFLYNNNPLDDAEYVWNFSVLNDFTYQTVMLNINQSVPDYDSVFIAEESKSFGKELVLSRYDRPDVITDSGDIDAYIELERKNLELFSKYFEEMKESKFVFFMAPLSILYWDEQTRLNKIPTLRTAFMETCKILTRYSNVKLYLWSDDEMLATISNLDNYIDSYHYNGDVSSEILRRIKVNEGLVTNKNYSAQVDVFFQYLETFDYESLFA